MWASNGDDISSKIILKSPPPAPTSLAGSPAARSAAGSRSSSGAGLALSRRLDLEGPHEAAPQRRPSGVEAVPPAGGGSDASSAPAAAASPAAAPAPAPAPAPALAVAPALAHAHAPATTTTSASATSAALVSRVFHKQTSAAMLTTLRAIAHRAAADMERWRCSAGRAQEDGLVAYWAAWASHMAGVKRTNERLLAFARASAAAAETYAAAMVSAAALLAPVASGEALTQLPPELGGGDPAPASSASLAHAAERSMHASTSAGIAAATKAAVAAEARAGGGGGGGGGGSGGGGGAGARRIASFSSAAGGSLAGGAGAQLSMCPVAGALVELHGQASRSMFDMALELSRDVCGDSDGPLGRRGDGVSHAEARLPASAARLAMALQDGTAQPPASLGELCAWYSALAADLVHDGNALTDTLAEVRGAGAGAAKGMSGAARRDARTGRPLASH